MEKLLFYLLVEGAFPDVLRNLRHEGPYGFLVIFNRELCQPYTISVVIRSGITRRHVLHDSACHERCH